MKRTTGAVLALLGALLIVACGKTEAPTAGGGAKPAAAAAPTPVPAVIAVDPVAGVDAKTLKPGLKLTTYPNNRFQGPGEVESVAPALGFDCDRNAYLNKEAALKYTGYLKVDKEATYCFQIITDDQATFSLNGKAIVSDVTGVKEQKVTLKPGYYELRFDWQNNVGPACLTVKWTPGACSSAAPIEAAQFFH
jgi:hypothetical protein